MLKLKIANVDRVVTSTGHKVRPFIFTNGDLSSQLFFEKNAKNVLIGIFSLHEVFQKFFFRQI